jgi:hypothetical protein
MFFKPLELLEEEQEELQVHLLIQEGLQLQELQLLEELQLPYQEEAFNRPYQERHT